MAVNEAPVLASIGDQQVDEGSTLTITLSATDPDVGDTLTYSATNAPTNSNISGNTFTFNPDFTQAGIYLVIFTVTDSGNLTDSETITISVGDANRPPVLDPIPAIQVNENETITITPQASDPDGDTLVYSVTGFLQGADYDFDPATGELVWRTTYDETGEYDITFTVDDER